MEGSYSRTLKHDTRIGSTINIFPVIDSTRTILHISNNQEHFRKSTENWEVMSNLSNIMIVNHNQCKLFSD